MWYEGGVLDDTPKTPQLDGWPTVHVICAVFPIARDRVVWRFVNELHATARHRRVRETAQLTFYCIEQYTC